MFVVPLQPIPNQAVQVQLNGQACSLAVQQYAYGLFINVSIGSTLIIAGVMCENRVRIVRDAYLGFSGDFVFVDTQGSANPDYTGLGSTDARYQLVYLEPDEVTT